MYRPRSLRRNFYGAPVNMTQSLWRQQPRPISSVILCACQCWRSISRGEKIERVDAGTQRTRPRRPSARMPAIETRRSSRLHAADSAARLYPGQGGFERSGVCWDWRYVPQECREPVYCEPARDLQVLQHDPRLGKRITRVKLKVHVRLRRTGHNGRAEHLE
jgi:hypothetical protein